MTQPINPYVAGPPLWYTQNFFGRQDTLEWVVRELHKPTTNALMLFGQRRIGKTSFLFWLQAALPANTFLPVYFELQDEHSTQPLGQLLADLAVAVTKAANLEPLARNVFDDQGHFFRDTFFPRLLGELGGERRLVFLLDEFDMLVRATRPTTSKAFLSFLRRLMRDTPWAAFVFIMGKGVAELSPDLMAIFKDASVGELWLLDQKSTEQLICQAETNGTLKFSEQAVASILNLTNCHPYLTQLLCKQIWDRA